MEKYLYIPIEYITHRIEALEKQLPKAKMCNAVSIKDRISLLENLVDHFEVKPITMKIKRCSGANYWYAKKIGQIVEVYISSNSFAKYELASDPIKTFDMADLEIL